jgi:Protein of unknown function (DUF2591)
MKIKVSEASGVVLDYLVVVARGFDVYHNATMNGCVIEGFWVSGYYPGDLNSWVPLNTLTHSTSWHLGGPIIDREEITIDYRDNETLARIWKKDNYIQSYAEKRQGLIAAMRCFIVSKLGDEVEVPDELA